jgi:Leucine-rich repeat (LRR) protein
MIEDKIKDRLEFLAKSFDVFDDDEIKSKTDKLKKDEFKYHIISDKSVLPDNSAKPLAILSYKENKENKERSVKNISVSLGVFSEIISADPTPNKSCVQWMLNVFVRYIKSNNTELAIRFVLEDLPQAKEYISLFESNKRKNKFKDLCKSSYILKNIKDATDINQYKSLSQLFDAVDPFIEKNPSEMESLLYKFVDIGQAEIPIRDRRFTLYIPKSLNASVIFDKFANWCTAKPSNGMFANYTQNYPRPDGSKSKLFIIINNKFFEGLSSEIYQIHFETNQIKDRHNNNNVSIFENVLHESESLSNFFYDELILMAKMSKGGLDNNKYLDYLIKFGFCESLFELIDANTPTIRFMTREIPRLPDISKFNNLDQLIITSAKMVELHPSIGKLKNLEMLVLTDNRIKSLPKEIGNLKNLTFINITGNPITEIPDEIRYLDKQNGGSLFRIAVKKEDIGNKNYEKLKQLLPSVKF